MAAKDDIREFLTTRRAKITPERAGLPVYGANRRVTGLRREEVALLAGISVEYYTRLERGSVGSVSDSVLDGLVDYDKALNDCVAFLRAEAGRDPYDKELSDLVGELSTRSEDFRLRWAAHDVRYHRTGRKRFHHPIVGDLELDYEAFELPCDPGQRLNIYTAPPDSPSAEALSLLASWSARQPVTTPAATGADGA
ncbi:MAG: helix-turn-helix domain-containing protein [Frankiaceae bacterium]